MSERQYAPTQSVATTEQIEATPQPTQSPSTEMNTSSPAASSPLVRATAQPNLGMTEGGQPVRAPAEREVAPSESAEQAPQPEQEGEGTPATAEQNGEGSAPAESEAPAVPSISRNPQDNPQFNQSMQKLKKGAKTVKTHEPAGKKVEAAKKAAKEPANAKAAGAKAKQVNKMQSADTDKKVDKSSFLELLRSEIEKVMPKKVEEGRDYMKGNDKKQLKSGLSAGISSEKEKTTASIDSTTQEQPDESNVEEKETTPLPEEESPQPPQGIGADKAIPPERSEEEIKPDKESAQEELDKNDLDQPQLEKANDPRFNAVVEAKNEADTYADTVPDSYRANEQTIRESTSVQGARNASRDLVSTGNTRVEADTTVQQAQGTQISSDEAARQKVSNDIEAIYQKTKTDVETQLSTLETDVNSVFDKGVDKAIKDMKDYVEDRFDKRYSGVRGKARWVKDKLLPLPDFVKAWFDQAHQQFRRDLDAVVVRVADMVESRLKKAKDRIDEGQTAIEKYVSTLEGDLKKYGETAATDVKGRFDDLRSSVGDKRKQLASSLAQRYKEAVDKGAQALQELKDAHKSLVERIRDAIVAVVKILREFKERIMSLLKKAAATIRLIIKDPIGFLKNILNAIKQGLRQFVSNIWKHLKAGFLGWMFGALGDAGLQMPAEFNLAGILSIVLQVLGLTYDRIRAKAVRLIGERNVAIIEGVVNFIRQLFTQGPAALWEQLKEYLSNLKEIVINAIQEWVVTKIITAAITKLVSMFNPVGAIIQAIITIYNVVMFLIERMPQILAFVQSVIDSIDNIVRGKIGAAANFIEQALARTLPIIISFLARLLGLGGISEKIKGIIKKIQERVDKAIDKMIHKIMSKASGLFSKKGGGKSKADNKEEKIPDDKQKAVADGLSDLEKIQDQHEEKGKIDRDSAEDVAKQMQRKHSVFKSIRVIDGASSWDYEISVNPKIKHKGAPKIPLTDKRIKELHTEANGLSHADVGTAMENLQDWIKQSGSTENVLKRYVGKLTDSESAETYVGYLKRKKNEGGTYQEPIAYLKGRASRKLGKAGEDKWIRMKYGSGKNNDSFEVMNDITGLPETVIPDILTPTVVGDSKDWADLSFTHQLRMFYVIARAKTQNLGKVSYRTGNIVATDRRFVLIVRHKSHSAGETNISGPLKAAADTIWHIITDADV